MSIDHGNHREKRDSFKSKWGFILACIGSAVGMGNIWMFPTRVSKYGGGAFLIPYFLFVAILGFSGVIGEMAFGRATRTGPVGAFRKAMESRGWNGRVGAALGMIPVLGSLALAIGYSVVVGWILKYMIGAFIGTALAPADIAGFGAAFERTASPYQGNDLWQTIALLICFGIMAFGIGKGIEKANKVMMPAFFLLFIVLAVYVAVQPGAAEGYRYIFSVDTSAFRDPMTWVYALGQAFFSLSLAGNGTLIYGSYLSDDEDIISSAWKVALFDTLAAMLAALTIIPAMAYAGSRLQSGGPGLLFIFIPFIFKSMPGGHALIMLFFVAVMCAGLTSLINLYETPIATVQNQVGLSRRQAVVLVATIGIVTSICIQGIVDSWMDFVSIYVCPLGAAMAGILFYWVFGPTYVRTQLQCGRRSVIGRWLDPMTRYVFCGLTLFVFVIGCIVPGGIG